MASYTPQDVFELLVVCSYGTHAAADRPLLATAAELCAKYADHYPDDTRLLVDVVKAAEIIASNILANLSKPEALSVVRQMQYCVITFEPSGKKRRKRFFGGTLFSREKIYRPDRADTAVTNLARYHVLSLAGGLPLAPRGWTL